jgi:hypothetical protein
MLSKAIQDRRMMSRRVHRPCPAAVYALLAALAVVLLISVTVAAVVDLHAGGFDPNCNLCLFNKTPLLKSNTLNFVPPSTLVIYHLRIVEVTVHNGRIVLAGLCRAPPSSLLNQAKV